MGGTSSKHPGASVSVRDVVLGAEKRSARKRRRYQYSEMEYDDNYHATATKLKTLLKANGGQAISELVPARHSSKSFKAQDRLEIQAEKAHLQKTCKLQNERLQDKRQELRALRYERETLEHKTNALEGENVALAGRRQELEARIAALETETTELRRENTVLAKKREDLEGRAAALESKNVQLAGQQDRLATELVITNLDERDMLDDGAVKNRWVGLENTVFNIAVQRYGVAPEPHVREPLEVFEGIVAEPHKWLTDGSRREWLIQAFIWNELVETVLGEYGFSARSYNLSGENRRVYSDYLKALRGECSRPDGITRLQYQKLKAAMNMVLSPVKKLNTERIAKVAREIEERLLPFQSPGFDAEACPPFADLVRDAAQLDADMAKCRAWYQISMYEFDEDDGTGKTWEERERDGELRTFGMDFNGEAMQDVTNKGGQTVLLVVSPMLVKWGDIDGKNFDVSRVLALKGVITG